MWFWRKSNGRHREANQALSGGAAETAGGTNSGAATGAGSTASKRTGAGRAEDGIENGGIVIGEVTAWRCWRIQKGFLLSMCSSHLWLPGEITSGGSPNASRLVWDGDEGHYAVPGGIHAFKSSALAIKYIIGNNAPSVVGRCHLWGDVVEHEHGYRAESSKPIAFDWLIANEWAAPDQILTALRKRYGLPEDGSLT